MSDKPSIKTKRQGSWRRVWVEVDGADASHLGYAGYPVRIGPHATLRMAGIGGVGTDPQYRRQGLARQVFAHAMSQLETEGYHIAGLFTSRNIVAHRLYRRFGFVDVRRRGNWRKLLDAPEYLRRMMSKIAQGREEFGRRRITLVVELTGASPTGIIIESGAARVAPAIPVTADLVLALDQATLVGLAQHELTMSYAVAANRLRWSGEEALFMLLAEAQASQCQPIWEG